MNTDGDCLRLVPERRADATVVEITGRLTRAGCSDLRDGLIKIATDVPDAIIADISGLRIHDGGLATVFAVIAQRIGDWPAIPFALVSPRPEHRTLLANRVIDRFVAVHADVAAAERARDRPPQRRATRMLPGSNGASAQARRFVRQVCTEWGLPEWTEDAGLVATELVDNAVQHTGTAVLSLRLQWRLGALTVAVGDDDPRPAVLHERLAVAEPGLGLRLVSQVARVWGSSRSWSGGKVVWAVLRPQRVS